MVASDVQDAAIPLKAVAVTSPCDGALNHDKAAFASRCFYLKEIYYSFLPTGKGHFLICITVRKSSYITLMHNVCLAARACQKYSLFSVLAEAPLQTSLEQYGMKLQEKEI